MTAVYKLTFRDYDGELSTASFPGTPIVAGTVDADTVAWQALGTATVNICRGVAASEVLVADDVPYVDQPASNSDAQRETKWECILWDQIQAKNHTLEIGCANLDLLAVNSAIADITGDTYIAFKTAMENILRSPVGNAMTLQRMQHKGANL